MRYLYNSTYDPRRIVGIVQFHQKKYTKEEVIFKEGYMPANYFQIIHGEVKMCNFNDDGREFVQGFFTTARVLANHPYSWNAFIRQMPLAY